MKWKIPFSGEGIEKVLDEELKALVGVGYFDYRRAMATTTNMPMPMFNAIVTLVDRSGVVEKLDEWDRESRKSSAGRKALISYRAVLVIELVTALWNKGVQYQEIASTITHRLTRRQFEALGIRWEHTDESTWMHRHWRAKQRMLKLIDPYHRTAKRKRLTLADSVTALAAKDDEREDRLRWVMQALVAASVAMLPQRYRDAYSGDVALDSTRIRVQGRVHSRAFTLIRKGVPLGDPEVVEASRTLLPGGRLTNADFTAGTYTRRDKGNEPAHELDFVTMMETEGYDDHPAFARLITAMSIHAPSAITEGPRQAMQAHAALFKQRGIVAADRAFNNSVPEDFQLPLRMDNWEFAFDYRKDQFGQQGYVPGRDIIVVDGAFYVAYMPHELIAATSRYKNGEPNPATGELYTFADIQRIIEARKPYQLKRHGSLASENKNGAQRFTYPDPATYRAFDPATGKPLRPKQNKLRGSVLIRPEAEFTKHLQRYPWGSPQWAAAYGQRNQVESTNSDIKRSRFVDIEDPQKRTGRGVAFHGLACALMVIAHNIRVLVRAIIEEHTPKKKAARTADRPTVSQPAMWMLGGADPDPTEPPGDLSEAA